jgi:hypothetical protein
MRAGSADEDTDEGSDVGVALLLALAYLIVRQRTTGTAIITSRKVKAEQTRIKTTATRIKFY